MDLDHLIVDGLKVAKRDVCGWLNALNSIIFECVGNLLGEASKMVVHKSLSIRNST
jgi:hypothetical protein